ncbi:hypothetical protein GPJ56_005185 [Histomonas meleagridis]|uniref:uncharacterized protein n=1 Tax=Histomonas meleagridis TaxID=135588 RepID=UPI003559395F|nr:hypothetical protein GPJ56_005185 [Histomonas meleagridis]KAH0802701.1 hypothetical protein GO595_004750 [Histomonas meleagridis]
MTGSSYSSSIFCGLTAVKGTVIDECLPATQTFTRSNTFTKSYDVGESTDIAIESFTRSYSLTQRVVVNSFISRTYSLTGENARTTYLEYLSTYYESKVEQYYSLFDINHNDGTGDDDNTKIYIIVGVVAAVVVIAIVAVILFLVIRKRNHKEMSSTSSV